METKTKKILIILLLVSTLNISYADDQLDVRNGVNSMRNSTEANGIIGDIMTKIFDINGKIKEVFLSITDNAINGYIPMWNNSKQLINSPLFYLAGKIGIGLTNPSEVLTLSGGLSLSKSPDSGDDVGNRDYNDARYLGLFSTASDSNLFAGLSSSAFQKDIVSLSCAYGISSINDNGSVVCISNETDPKVGTLNTNFLPKWSGSTLSDSIIFNTGSFVGIGTTSPLAELEVNGNIITDSPTSSGQVATKGYVDNVLPSGAIMAFYLASCPSGWLTADGTNGTPDLRGAFIRGMNGNLNGRDTSRVLGDYQADSIASHSHTFGYAPTALLGGTTSVGGSSSSESATKTTSTTGGTETRPKNIALMYCMKQ